MSEENQESITCTPPKLISRNEYGLICSPDFQYVYSDDGTINWRKMLKMEHLVPNKQRTNETDVSKIDDKHLLILLSGIKYLAYLRGVTSVKYKNVSPSPDYVVSSCEIDFIPNYETEGRAVTFSSVGDASLQNTHGFGSLYLGPIAENRAFVRCVRNFLRINVVAFDEVLQNNTTVEASIDSTAASTSPVDALIDVMNEKKVTWEMLHKRLIEENYPNAKDLNSVSDLPGFKIFELIGRIKKISR